MGKVKKAHSYIHPNSRKAMQMSRANHRVLRLEGKREEANKKLKRKLNMLKWFKANVDPTKKCYSPEEVHSLIEKYFQRYSEEEEKLKELESIKGRHNNERMSHEYKIKFLPQEEKRNYESTGLEFPNLTKQDAFQYFLNWNGEARYLPAIAMMKISKPSKCK